MIRHRALDQWTGGNSPRHDDGGFTMVELLVAMGVFTVLIAIMSAITVTSMNAIRTVNVRSQLQGDASLAMEQATRMLRYATRPNTTTPVIASASPTSITFYTYSGTGVVGDVPYKVALLTRTINGSPVVVARTYAPTVFNGDWGTYSSTYTEHRLFTAPDGAVSPLKIVITKCSVADGTVCFDTRAPATPANESALTLSAGQVPDTVTISIGDQREPLYVVTQQVGLVNSIGQVNAT